MIEGHDELELLSEPLVAADVWLRIVKLRGVPVVRVPQGDPFSRGSRLVDIIIITRHNEIVNKQVTEMGYYIKNRGRKR